MASGSGAALAAALIAAGRRGRCPRAARAARRLRPRAHRVRARRVPARHRDPAPAALSGGAARQRGRGRAGAPHAGRRLPVREQARRGAARVPQAARAAPRLPLRSAARSAARRRLLQRRASRKRRRRSPTIEARAPASATRSWRTRRQREADAPARAAGHRRATSGTRSRSTSSRSAPGSSRTASGARAGCSSAPRRRWARSRWARSRPTSALYGLDAARARCTRSAARRASQCPPGVDRSLAGGHVAQAAAASRSSAAALFFAVAIWGVIDAVRNFQPEVPLAGVGDGTTVARGRPLRPRASRLSPDGLGAAWAF